MLTIEFNIVGKVYICSELYQLISETLWLKSKFIFNEYIKQVSEIQIFLQSFIWLNIWVTNPWEKKKKKVFMSDSIKFNNLNCASKFVIQNIQEK